VPPKARALLRGAALLALLALIGAVITQRASQRGQLKLTHTPQLSAQALSEGVGVSLGLFASDPAWDYEVFLKELKALGVERLMIVVPLKQDTHTSSAPWLGVPMGVIGRTLSQASALGFKLSLMPVIQLEHRRMDIWRGKLAPQAPERWWGNYSADLRRLAALAERLGVERLVIGSELCSLEGELKRWEALISLTRAHFKGALTYSANWDHYREVPFWALLDEVSVTAYFPLASLHTLEGQWRAYLSEVERFAAEQGAQGEGRPLLITEYGYPALESALKEPWNETTRAPFAPKLQAELVARSTSLLKERSAQGERLRGAFLWNWFGFGGSLDRGYTLRGREGEERLKAALKGEP